jgi:predicted dehydrogenase
MEEKATEKRLILLTAFKFRFHDEVLKAKEVIEKGSLGRVLNFRLMFSGYMNMTQTWYVNKELSGGGVIMDNGPHAVDLVRFLLGETAVSMHMSHL